MENNETKVGFIARYAKIATVIAVIFGSSSGLYP